MNGRNSGGFSLRRSLEDQGLTTEAQMRYHLNRALILCRINPQTNLTQYRV